MIIMKFGGTSVSGKEEIRNVCALISKRRKKEPVVVVSAVSGITDMLLDNAKKAAQGLNDPGQIIEKHNAIIRDLGLELNSVDEMHKSLSETYELITSFGNCSKKLLDRAASFGERISARIVAAYLNKIGCKAVAVDAFDIGFVTDDNFGDAEIMPETYANIRKQLDYRTAIPIVTGFIAKNKYNRITTLGRGGSDYTAAIIGSALEAEEIQIWTDVNGVMSADPQIIPDARTIDTMSFAEASELAYFGAKVLHPKTILPAIDNEIPVKVLNTNEPDNPGTTILNTRDDIVLGRVRSVTSKKDISVITVISTRMLDASGFMQKLFCTFAKHNIIIDMISTSEVSVSATVNSSVDLKNLADDLEGYAKVHIEKDKAIVCVVGEGLNNSVGLAGKVFSCMGNNGININMISQGASEINISFTVDKSQADNAVKSLHMEFMRM